MKGFYDSDPERIDLTAMTLPQDIWPWLQISVGETKMDNELNELLNKILSMSQEQRAFLVDKLIDSLESKADLDVELAWQKEIQKRIEEAEKGQATFISWEDVKQKLQEH